MRVNRLELLKANIGLELISVFDDLDKYFSKSLTGAALTEFERQAGILGLSVPKKGYNSLVESVLNGNRSDEYALDLVHPHRLIFKEVEGKIKVVMITEIVDYH